MPTTLAAMTGLATLQLRSMGLTGPIAPLPDAASSTLLEDVLTDFEEPEGDTFYWIATESRRARMMRKFIEGHLGVPRDWIRSTGYWKAHPDETDGD
jgi:NADPH-dependent ferric siderophore reductase